MDVLFANKALDDSVFYWHKFNVSLNFDNFSFQMQSPVKNAKNGPEPAKDGATNLTSTRRVTNIVFYCDGIHVFLTNPSNCNCKK